VHEDNKREELLKLLTQIEGRTLIFVATKRSADILEHYLYEQGYSTASIHGDRTQYERENALEAFKNGKARILVATDVAARGLHIDNVTHVINYDLPSNIDDYVHRIGRTGRCGKVGIATGFFNDSNTNIVKELILLLRESSQEIPDWLYDYEKDYSFKKKKSFQSFGNRDRSFGSPKFGRSGFGNSYSPSPKRSFSRDFSEKNERSSPKPFYSSYNRGGNDQWNDESN